MLHHISGNFLTAPHISTVVDWGFGETNRISSNRARLIKMLQRLNCSFTGLDSAINSVREVHRKCVPKKWFWFAEFLWCSLSSTWLHSPSLVCRQPSEIVLSQWNKTQFIPNLQLLRALKCISFFLSFFVLTSVYLLIVGVEVIVAPDHKMTHTHISVELLWTRDRPVAEISTWQHTQVTSGRLHAPGGIRMRTPSSNGLYILPPYIIANLVINQLRCLFYVCSRIISVSKAVKCRFRVCCHLRGQ